MMEILDLIYHIFSLKGDIFDKTNHSKNKKQFVRSMRGF